MIVHLLKTMPRKGASRELEVPAEYKNPMVTYLSVSSSFQATLCLDY